MTGEGRSRTRALAAEAFAELSTNVPVHAGDQTPAPPPVARPARRTAGGTATARPPATATPRASATPAATATPAAAATPRASAQRRAVAAPRAGARPGPAAKQRPAARRQAALRAALPAAPAVATRPRLALAVLVTAAVLSLLDATLLGMAIPSLRAAFGASGAEARWAVTVHLVAMGMALPVAAGLGERLGAARLLRWSLAVFTVASLLGGLAWNLDLLLVLRAVHGAAAGLVLPVSVALLCRIRPGRAWAAALLGGLLVAPATVPALGAWLAGQLEWRVLLLVNLPLGAAALLGARLWLPLAPGERGGRADLAGMATAALAAGALLLALLQGAAWGWASYPILGLLGGCLLSLALLAAVELSVPEPLVDLRALRSAAAALPPLLLAVAAVVLAAGFVEVPLLLQGAGHIGALQVGSTLLLPTALAAAAMAASLRLCTHAGARWPAASGLLLVALGTYLLHGVPPSEAGRLVLCACLRGAGLGLALAPLTAAIPAAAQRVRGAAAITAVCLLLPAAAGVAVVSSALAVPLWWPGGQGAAATVQERVVLLHGDVALPLAGPTFLHTVLLTAALAALGALLALRLPAGGGRAAG